MNKEIAIIVATHKSYKFPENDIYMPLHVGKYGKNSLGYMGDDTGENISNKNSTYCELTGMYWAYKNLSCDYIGLMHYRRYLKKDEDVQYKDIYDSLLDREEIENLLKNYDIILPKKSKNIQKSVRVAYKKMHFIKDLNNVQNIIIEKYPEYVDAFNKVMDGNELCLCNMFIMSKNNFDNYCSWLFDILFELEKITDLQDYSPYQKRIYGFLGERLFNVWLEYNKNLNKYYLPVLETEPLPKKDFYKMLFKNVFGIRD